MLHKVKRVTHSHLEHAGPYPLEFSLLLDAEDAMMSWNWGRTQNFTEVHAKCHFLMLYILKNKNTAENIKRNEAKLS